MALYLTYDNQAMQDGLGAQALRITGVYSIAKQFRVKYLHSPIEKAIEDIAHNLGGGVSLDALIGQVNSFFSFPSDELMDSEVTHIYTRTLSRKRLMQLILKSFLSQRNLVVHILIPM